MRTGNAEGGQDHHYGSGWPCVHSLLAAVGLQQFHKNNDMERPLRKALLEQIELDERMVLCPTSVMVSSAPSGQVRSVISWGASRELRERLRGLPEGSFAKRVANIDLGRRYIVTIYGKEV